MLNIAWLLERLVTQLLSEASGSLRVRAQYDLPLDTLRRLAIKPDLVFCDGPRIVAVADTKYKLLDDNRRFSNADAYQLVTYCARLGLEVGHLIQGAGVRLLVHSVDLAQPISGLEAEVAALLRRITSRV